MTATHKNRLKTTISAVAGAGLGALTISTASSGHRTFGAGDNGLTFDGVLIAEGTAWEVRDGCVYTHSGTSLSRGTLMDSSTGSAVAFTSAAVVTQGGAAAFADLAQQAMAAVMPGGRLTLESGVPVSTTDQTAKTSVFYTPFVHNVVPLWDGYKWAPTEFAEKTLALGTLTSGRPYDVFGYLSSGQLVLESLSWTNDTTRATGVTLQDGRYCKSGDKTRLFLGTFYTTSTTTTEDSAVKRFVWNAYNRITRTLLKQDSTGSWTYAGTTPRYANNSSANRVDIVCGIAGASAVTVLVGTLLSSGIGTASTVGIGKNSSTAYVAGSIAGYCYQSELDFVFGRFSEPCPLGLTYYAWCEAIQSGGSGNALTQYGAGNNFAAGLQAETQA